MSNRARPVTERFWEKVVKTEQCWLWTGSTRGGGYGVIRDDLVKEGSVREAKYRRIGAYHISLRIVGREPAKGEEVHHLCGNRSCVRPDHLQVVTRAPHRALHARWNRQDVIAALRECAEINRRDLFTYDFSPTVARQRGMEDVAALHVAKGWPWYTTIRDLFGSWTNALEAAGLKSNPPGRPKKTPAPGGIYGCFRGTLSSTSSPTATLRSQRPPL